MYAEYVDGRFERRRVAGGGRRETGSALIVDLAGSTTAAILPVRGLGRYGLAPPKPSGLCAQCARKPVWPAHGCRMAGFCAGVSW